MNDIDSFEREFARLLNRSVDERVGPRRSAPPMRPSVWFPGRSTVRRWLVPLAVAACVVAVVGGTVGVTELRSAHRGTPGNSGPARPTSTSPGPGPTVVRLGGATLRLPVGWVARDYRSYLTPGSTMTPGSAMLESQAWCLTPADRPVSKTPFACPVAFSAIAAHAARDRVDVDYEGGYLSQPQYCPPQNVNFSSARSADVSFGGREADFRRFDYRCPYGKQWRIEQYVVASGPGYLLYSLTVDDQISAAMAQIVASATLPAQTSAVRYYDHGYVRSITPLASGARITLDRVVPGPDGPVNDNPQTYGYFVEQSAKPDGLRVGELISLFTDGSQVTEYYNSF